MRRHFGGFAAAVARGLKVRHDHGSQYMSDHFRKEIAFLGIESSPAFVRAPEGNGCAERFIRTLKENLLWVRTFETIEELRQALLAFRETYNTNWLIERHGFMTPTAFRQMQLQPVAKAAQASIRCPTNRGRYREPRKAVQLKTQDLNVDVELSILFRTPIGATDSFIPTSTHTQNEGMLEMRGCLRMRRSERLPSGSSRGSIFA